MADGGMTVASSDLSPSSADDQIEALKRTLQDQRRRTTLLHAELQRQTEAREAIQAQLMEAHTELAAHRDRRKEMARVINNREVKIAELKAELEARYQELAAMQRQVMRRSPVGWVKMASRRLRRLTRKPSPKD